jgi:site-specific DNA recombinase
MNRILDNLFYTGNFRYSGIYYRGQHEAIISVELYNAVQLKRSKYKNIIRQERNLTYTGFLTCSHCGSSITGCVKFNQYTYYNCTQKKCYNEKCINNEYMREEILETLIIEQLKKLGCCDTEYFKHLPGVEKRQFLQLINFSGKLDINHKKLVTG